MNGLRLHSRSGRGRHLLSRHRSAANLLVRRRRQSLRLLRRLQGISRPWLVHWGLLVDYVPESNLCGGYYCRPA